MDLFKGLIILSIVPQTTLSVLIGLLIITVGKSSLINSSNDLATENGSLALVDFINFIAQIIIVLVLIFSITVEAGRSPDSTGETAGGTSTSRFYVSALIVSSVPLLALVYIKMKSFRKPTGERVAPLITIPTVFIAAFLKRDLSLPGHPNELYEEDNPRDPMEHTNGLRFMDKAAIKEPSCPEEERSGWLCTITQVEECKRLLRMVPICTAFLAYGMVKSIGNTFFLEQGNQMNTKFGNTDFPVAAFLYLADLSESLAQILYRKLISDKLEGGAKMFSPTIEYAMGMVLSTLCCVSAAWISLEIYTKSDSLLSVYWLTPQFVIFGAMNGLASEGIQEFYSAQLPPSMKGYDSVFTEALIGVGSLFVNLLLLPIQVATNWFEDDANDRFDRFYLLMTVVAVIIFFLYCFFAVRYRYDGDSGTILHPQTQVQEENDQEMEHIISIDPENSLEENVSPVAELRRATLEEQDYEQVGLSNRYKRLVTL